MVVSSKAEHEEAIKRIMTPHVPNVSNGGQERLRWWTADEVKLLRELYQKENTQALADKLGRTLGSVHRKACNIGITQRLSVWSSEELNLLREIYSNTSVMEISERLGRSVPAIRAKAFILKVTKPHKSHAKPHRRHS
jgi:hypothetical protein